MAGPEHGFDKWNLPKSDLGDTKPSNLGHPEDDIIYTWKLKVFNTWTTYKKYPNAKNEKDLRIDVNKLLLYRTAFFDHVMSERRPDAKATPEWDGTRAETMTTHMIYSRDSATNTHAQLPGSPLQYVLRDPESNRGPNLVALYKAVCKDSTSQEHRLAGARVVWKGIQDFMLKGCGTLIAEGVSSRKASNAYGAEQMQALADAMATAQEAGVLRHTDSGHALGLEYHGYDWEGLRLIHAGGEIHFKVRLGATTVNDLNSILYPEYTRRVVSRTMTHFIEAHAGLFVSIVLSSGAGQSEHFLFLSEYERNMMKGLFAHGYEDAWDTDENGNMSFKFREVALAPAVIDKPLAHPGARAWVVSSPLTERMVLEDSIATLGSVLRMNTGEPLQRLHQWATTNAATIAPPGREQDNPVSMHFFSGDNVMFMTLAFNTRLDWVCALLGLDRDEADGRRYIAVTTVRYPALFANVEKFMIKMRFEYFMDNGGRAECWKKWKRGLWSLPTGGGQVFDPRDYQEPPTMDDPLDKPVPDLHGRMTYPSRRVTSLPYHATYRGICERRRRQRKSPLPKSYFVNNLDPDPEVVYVYPLAAMDDTDAIWNDTQLFRINAERLVSRELVARSHESFFTFRRSYWAAISNGSLMPPNPFKLYIEAHPEIQVYWRMLWDREYDGMSAWERREPNPEHEPTPEAVPPDDEPSTEPVQPDDEPGPEAPQSDPTGPPTGPDDPNARASSSEKEDTGASRGALRGKASGVRLKEALRRGINERFLLRRLHAP